MKPRMRLVFWLWLALFLAGPLVACYGPEYESVHFHTDRPDFLQMPHPWPGVPPETRALVAGEYVSRYFHEDEKPPRSVALATKGLQMESEGRFHEAAAVWSRLRPALRDETASFDSQTPPQAQGLEDRIAALRAWRGPADTPSLEAYFKARTLVNAKQYEEAGRLISRMTAEPYRLRAQYLQAAVLFYSGTPEASAAAYRAILKHRPHDLLARYMIGRSYFAAVREADDADAANTPTPSGKAAAVKSPPKLEPAVRARYLKEALAAYAGCASSPGAGSLARDADGMAAACLYRLEEYPGALLRYCRQLAALPAGQEDSAAWISGQWCLKRMGPVEHRAFQQLALQEPGAASVYLDLLLHYHRLGLQSHYRLGLFALEVLKRSPQAPVSARMLARLALIEDRAGHYGRAERLAAAGLAKSALGADRDPARWQHALALHHLRRDAEALREYERLAREAVTPRMRRGAHEAAAVLCERLHDLPQALNHYFALEYQLDYGYVIDCLASQADLRAFLRRFPNHPRAKLVRYSLGFRQLRAGEYDAAARTFASLGPWLEVAEKKFDCQTNREEPRSPPLRTARFLAAETRREAAARTPEEKAKVAYGIGQFLFRQRHLVLYNGALWTGSRTSAFQLQQRHNIQTPEAPLDAREEQAYGRYQHEHAALYQALRVFERIARQYPHTPEAPKALYSAALCYSFLPSLEAYWRDSDREFTAKATACYRRLQRDYPDDPLARDAARWGGPLPAAGKGKP